MNTLADMLGPNDQHWMDNPARNCASPSDAALDVQLHADAWFPTEQHTERAARKLCAGCPVKVECATYALAVPGLEGVWGGMSAAERRQIQKRTAA